MNDDKFKNGRELGDLVKIVSDKLNSRAMRDYLDSDEHLLFVLAEDFTVKCHQLTAQLQSGEIPRWLDICRDQDAFVGVLANSATIKCPECEPPCELDEETDNWIPLKVPIEDETYDRLAKLPVDELHDLLLNKYDCADNHYLRLHTRDSSIQSDFYKAVKTLFRTAAARAKQDGDEEAAKQWLEALRLIMPNGCLEDPPCSYGFQFPAISAQCAAKSYSLAQDALAKQWVNAQFRDLKPLEPANPTKKDV